MIITLKDGSTKEYDQAMSVLGYRKRYQQKVWQGGMS